MLIIGIPLLLLILGTIFGIYYFERKHNTEEHSVIETEGENWTGKKEIDKEQTPPDSIAIPGFDSIELEKDKTIQNVNFYNPKQNNCYFKMKLMLEDGTLLWESKYIEPNKGVYDIELLVPLSEGEYNAFLKYETFTMNEKQEPLNGSEISMIIFAV